MTIYQQETHQETR